MFGIFWTFTRTSTTYMEHGQYSTKPDQCRLFIVLLANETVDTFYLSM